MWAVRSMSHCIIYQQALGVKSLGLQNVAEPVLPAVEFIRLRGLIHGFICVSEACDLPYGTVVR